MARSRRRIALLDELRGLALVLMVFFHAFYLIGYTFDVVFFRQVFQFFLPAQPWFAGLFIFICGICCNLSRNNLKRGLLLAGTAGLLSAVLWCAAWWRILTPNDYIWFGILHLLAACILLYTLLRPTLHCIPPLLGLLICAVLFLLCYHVSPENGGWFGVRGLFTVATPAAPQDHPLLYALGLCPISNCGDYFPLLPWLFCFLAGSFTGVWAARGKFPKWTSRRHVPFLAAVGRYSLLIYLFHQPILYLLCEGLFWLMKQL